MSVVVKILAGTALLLCPTVVLAHEADRYLVHVCSRDDAACEQQRTDFRRLVKAAYRGDLSAQRGVARALWRGTPVVPAQWRAGCAWHMTIAALKPKGLAASDLESMRTNCGLLNADEITLARNEAQLIGRRIAAGGKIDETVNAHAQDPKLDSVAEPLFP